MSATVEPTVQWSQDQMVEVLLNEPDDDVFEGHVKKLYSPDKEDILSSIKELRKPHVKERRKKLYQSICHQIKVLAYTSREDTSLVDTLRNCLRLMESTQT